MAPPSLAVRRILCVAHGVGGACRRCVLPSRHPLGEHRQLNLCKPFCPNHWCQLISVCAYMHLLFATIGSKRMRGPKWSMRSACACSAAGKGMDRVNPPISTRMCRHASLLQVIVKDAAAQLNCWPEPTRKRHRQLNLCNQYSQPSASASKSTPPFGLVLRCAFRPSFRKWIPRSWP